MTHRKWWKVVFNPALRLFGWSIVSVFEGDKFLRYELKKYPENCKKVKAEDE